MYTIYKIAYAWAKDAHKISFRFVTTPDLIVCICIKCNAMQQTYAIWYLIRGVDYMCCDIGLTTVNAIDQWFMDPISRRQKPLWGLCMQCFILGRLVKHLKLSLISFRFVWVQTKIERAKCESTKEKKTIHFHSVMLMR